MNRTVIIVIVLLGLAVGLTQVGSTDELAALQLKVKDFEKETSRLRLHAGKIDNLQEELTRLKMWVNSQSQDSFSRVVESTVSDPMVITHADSPELTQPSQPARDVPKVNDQDTDLVRAVMNDDASRKRLTDIVLAGLQEREIAEQKKKQKIFMNNLHHWTKATLVKKLKIEKFQIKEFNGILDEERTELLKSPNADASKQIQATKHAKLQSLLTPDQYDGYIKDRQQAMKNFFASKKNPLKKMNEDLAKAVKEHNATKKRLNR